MFFVKKGGGIYTKKINLKIKQILLILQQIYIFVYKDHNKKGIYIYLKKFYFYYLLNLVIYILTTCWKENKGKIYLDNK